MGAQSLDGGPVACSELAATLHGQHPDGHAPRHQGRDEHSPRTRAGTGIPHERGHAAGQDPVRQRVGDDTGAPHHEHPVFLAHHEGEIGAETLGQRPAQALERIG